jgi:hypothetical protein
VVDALSGIEAKKRRLTIGAQDTILPHEVADLQIGLCGQTED